MPDSANCCFIKNSVAFTVAVSVTQTEDRSEQRGKTTQGGEHTEKDRGRHLMNLEKCEKGKSNVKLCFSLFQPEKERMTCVHFPALHDKILIE